MSLNRQRKEVMKVMRKSLGRLFKHDTEPGRGLVSESLGGALPEVSGWPEQRPEARGDTGGSLVSAQKHSTVPGGHREF